MLVWYSLSALCLYKTFPSTCIRLVVQHTRQLQCATPTKLRTPKLPKSVITRCDRSLNGGPIFRAPEKHFTRAQTTAPVYYTLDKRQLPTVSLLNVFNIFKIALQMRIIQCLNLYTCADMVLLYEHIEYMHDDYETINSRGLVAFKKKN